MRILVLTVGSRGDVEPYVALGRGLDAAGHTVSICTCRRFEDIIARHGLGYHHLDDGLLDLLESDLGRRLIEELTTPLSALRTLRSVITRVGPIQQAMIRDAWSAATDARPDVIVYHPKMFFAPWFAAALDVPAVLAPLYPLHLPTGAFPYLGFPRLPLGRPYNRATYRLVHALTSWGGARHVRAWRAEHDREGRSRHASPVRTARNAPIPVIHGYSRHVGPVPTDWPSSAVVSGYWFMPEDPAWTPSPGLEAFIDAGPPPIYVGFGSMARSDPRRTTGIVLAAIERTRVRAILATGWGGLIAEDLPDDVLALDEAPHAWLFPRMAAVVHHGGAGTTAAGLRAGRPTVVCPFALDQPFWGACVQAVGAGVRPVPQKKLTVETLADALGRVTNDDAIRRSARAVGERIRAEDGVAVAVTAIESLLEAAAAHT